MPADQSPKTARKPRADAERNRQKLLEAARAAFMKHGALVSMEEVARSAGVGIGTLYRHFPNRNDLVVEAYRSEMSRLLDAAHSLAASQAPLDALKSWLLLFVDHLADNIILADAVKSLVGEKSKEEEATQQLSESLAILFERPVADGRIADSGIEPLDLLRAIYGVATASPASNWEDSARRMVDILIAGLKQR